MEELDLEEELDASPEESHLQGEVGFQGLHHKDP